MNKEIPIQTYLTRLMLLEKENSALRTALEKTGPFKGQEMPLAANAKDKYDHLMASQLESTLVLDMQKHPPQIHDCNARATDLLNTSRQDILQREILDFIPSDQKKHFLDHLQDILRFHKHHFELIRTDVYHEKQVLDIIGYFLIKNKQNFIVLQLRDVTFHDILLQASQPTNKEKEEEPAFKNYPIFSLFFQFNGETFTLAKAENEKGELVFREKLRLNARELFPGRNDILIDMRQCLREGLRFSRECFFKSFFTDNILFVSIQYAYLPPDYVVMHIYDLTQQKAMQQELMIAREKAEQSERLKNAFLTNINAELRTPLNAINGFAQLIASGAGENHQQVQYGNQIQNNIRHLMRMINDTMELARIESGDLKVIYSGIALNQTMNEYLQLYQQEAAASGKEHLQFEVKKALPDHHDLFDTDSERLRQIMGRLLDNAVRFTQKGKITFGYEVKREGIVFFVQDTGVGISKEEQKHIFTRFYKADNQEITTEPGIGLGLSIAMHLAKSMGAQGIDVTSTPAKGSRFSFEIPR
ncbi:MAG: ATP-binding protein [Bacteroidales bacterium]|nr:ATP-binding protein [Bacteroidales bacterium]